MDWASAAVGIGGLLVAALSLWLSYKDRSSTHRELLYQKQLEAYPAVINSLDPLFSACMHFILAKDVRPPLDNEMRRQLRLATDEVEKQFRDEYRKWYLYLPSVVHDKISEFLNVLSAITASDDIADLYPYELVHSAKPDMELADARWELVAAARRALGTEPLSEDTLKLVGSDRTEERKKHKPSGS